MNTLDSPLEALAFNFLSYDALDVLVNNFWTLLALITGAAGISFVWTIKSTKSVTLSFYDPDIIKTTSFTPRQEESVVEPLSTPINAVKTTDSVRNSNEDGVVRGKFVNYYYEKVGDVSDICDEVEEECEGVDGDGDMVRLWERKGGINEMGWYRYQDLTVFNGDVVRLWGSSKRKRPSLGFNFY